MSFRGTAAARPRFVITAPAKLLTVVLPESAEPQLHGELREIGVVGYTATTARGHGVHGDRPSRFYGDNMRVEILASPEVVDRVLDLLERKFRPVNPLVAWVVDAHAYPPEKVAHL